MDETNLPPLIKARVYLTVPGAIDPSRFCKVESMRDHPIMQWLIALAGKPTTIISNLPGYGRPKQEWVVIESDFRWFGNDFNIHNLTERECETLSMLLTRGEVIMIIHEKTSGGGWVPSEPPGASGPYAR